MPNFDSDLSQEEILSKYLDSIYSRKGLDFKRVFNLNQQHQGIDIIIDIKNIEYLIDEKAQLHYLNKDLPTFTFELSFLKDNQLKIGWLLDKKKLTQYYFLITGIYLKRGRVTLSEPEDIEKLKITSVNRDKLIKHLSFINLHPSRLEQYDVEIRHNDCFGKNEIPELNPKSEGLIFYTNHLTEKPINLQLRLSYLIEKKLAKKFHYV